MNNSEIAEAWLTNCRDAIEFGSDSEEAEATFWAYSELDRLCSSDPSRALDIIESIADAKPEERVLNNLAAGPLEDVLNRHGEAIIGEIERRATRKEVFLALLLGVWTDRMPPSVQARVQALADKAELSPHALRRESKH